MHEKKWKIKSDKFKNVYFFIPNIIKEGQAFLIVLEKVVYKAAS